MYLTIYIICVLVIIAVGIVAWFVLENWDDVFKVMENIHGREEDNQEF